MGAAIAEPPRRPHGSPPAATLGMSSATAPAPAPRGGMQRRPRFGIFQFVILLGNVCGSGPFSFPIVFSTALGVSYLIRILRPEQASLLTSTPVFLVAYYLCIGAYRLLIYNRKCDPLLAVPGPRGHWITGMNQAILENEVMRQTPQAG